MKTIITTLPIYDAKNKQLYERASSVMQSADLPPMVITPRHRLPSFQWIDQSDAETGFSSIELISNYYTGAETTICTDWISHFADTTFTHTGLSITSCVTATVFTCTSNTFSVKAGDVIRIQGTLVGAVAPYPQIYMNPDAYTVYSLDNGVVDLEYKSRVTSSAASFTMFSNVAITFNFLSVTITRVEEIRELFWFMYPDVLPEMTHDYYIYYGGTLNYPLDPGNYYLKITGGGGHVYYSEWFKVDCVYENLIDTWGNNGYETFTTTGTSLNVANTAGAAGANTYSDLFTVGLGEIITVRFNMTFYGTAPNFVISKYGGLITLAETCVNGLNEIQFTTTWEGETGIVIFTYALNDSYSTSDIIITRTYSDKYITVDFSNVCDLGDILYHSGMIQTLWIVSEPMEVSFPQEEEGMKNGEGRFVRTFARQTKKYLMRTNLLPDYMVDVFNRMKLHDTIELTNLVGDINTVYNLEVEHEWFDTDKYFAKMDLTFDYDETFVIAGCCNNIV